MKLIKKRQTTRFGWMLAAAISTGVGTVALAQDDAEEEIFELSPFEVTVNENDIGYHQQNTLAGSRLNTNIADLAASISVVTKQQMEDTASLDINDIFRYEVGTEGSATYTPGVQSLRNDGVVDVNAGYTHGGDGQPQTNATANRVRGLGSPQNSINFYRAVNQVPLDSYNVQSIEISRGPNSMLFGIGSPAGFVNQSQTNAVLDQDAYTLGVRFDDRGSKRGSFSFNKALVEDKLAFFGAYLRDEREFERKPSYDDTERFYAAITYKPFEKTRIKASFENYENSNSRPNTLTPRDFVTEWRNAGQPVYDPSTMMVTKLDTGEVVGPFVGRSDSPFIDDVRDYIRARPGYDPTLWNTPNTAGTNVETAYNGVSISGSAALTNPNSALYVPGLGVANARPTMQVANGQVINWFQAQPGQYREVFGTPENPSGNAPLVPPFTEIQANDATARAVNQFWSHGNAWTQNGSNIGSYRYPGVTDKSIYDWTKTNILSMNFGEDENQTYNIEFEQQLTDDLFFSAGWFRQNYDSLSSYTVSQLNVATLFVDTNVTLPDGSPNPYLGQTYVEDFDPDRFVNKIDSDQYRAMLAYTPDFTDSDGWTKWLGRHQFIAFASREEVTREFRRQRLNFIAGDEVANGTIRFLANPNNNAAGERMGWRNEGASSRRTYYLSNPGDPYGTATRGSGALRETTYTGPLDAYNLGNGQWEAISMTHQFKDHSASTNRSQTEIDSFNLGGTSYLWNNRVIATYGVRKDTAANRLTTTGPIVDIDGNVLEPAMTDPERWVDGVYQTDVILNRYNRWDEVDETTSTTGVVFKPFHNWRGIDDRAQGGSLFHEFISTLGLTYNKSDTFNPPTSAQVDIFGDELPKPSGVGEDWGIQFSLFENKLFARISQFKSSNEYERINGGTPITRLWDQFDQGTFRNWARTISMINMGMDPRVEGFGENLSAEQSAAIEDAAEVIWGQPYNYYGELPGAIGATRSVRAEGTELQLTYNPIPNWTIKLTGSKQETIYSDVLNEFSEWFDFRSPVWDAAQAADYLLPDYQGLATYTTPGGRAVSLGNFWDSYGYVTQVTLDEVNGNTSARNYYNNIVTPQVTLARDLDGQVVTGQSKYRAALITNYRFDNDALRGFSVGGSLRWQDKASIGYFGRSSGANPNPDFIDVSDTTRPIYTPAETYTDLWAAYSRTIMDESVNMKVQLNIVNAFESGGLQTVGVNYDGSPNAYRIVDPRQFILSLNFEM